MKSGRLFLRAACLVAVLLGGAGVALAGVVDMGPRLVVASGDDPDCAVDSKGAVHIVYYRGGNTYYQKIQYPSGGVVVGERLVGSGGDPQVAIDSQDNPHVVFGSMRYAYWTGNGFSAAISVYSAKSKPRIAIDQLDRVFAMAQANVAGHARPDAHDSNGSPVTGNIVMGGDNTGAIDVDKNGIVHISWRGGRTAYHNSYNPNTGLTTGSVGIHGDASDFSDIKVDQRDNSLHEVHTGGGGNGIDYQYRSAAGLGARAALRHDRYPGRGCITVLTIGVDAGLQVISPCGRQQYPYSSASDRMPNMNAVYLVDATASGGKYENPNIACPPDMTAPTSSGATARSISAASVIFPQRPAVRRLRQPGLRR